MDELSAELLSKLDNELQQVKIGLVSRFPDLDLEAVLPIGEVGAVHSCAWLHASR